MTATKPPTAKRYTVGPLTIGWKTYVDKSQPSMPTYTTRRTFVWPIVTPEGNVLAKTSTRKDAAAVADALNHVAIHGAA